MIAVAVACLPIFANGYTLSRWEGALFTVYYAGYLGWIVLDASDHALRDSYGVIATAFVLPLTVVTLLVVAARAWRQRPAVA